MSKKSYEHLRGPVAGLLLVLSCVASASNTSVPEGKSRYQASAFADRIVLLPATDAASSQAVGWRSNQAQSQLQWVKAMDGPALELDAKTLDVKGTLVKTDNGPAYFYKASMSGLQSDTLYAYRVKGEGNWSEWLQFRTAKAEFEPFSLLYFGDAQNNLKAHFSRLVRSAQQHVPQAKLMLHAGDLVNSRYGILDHEWGEWFDAIGWVGAMTPQLIAAGNHEYLKSTNAKGEERRELAAQFTAQFQSLNNGPAALQDTVFYHDYQGVRFIVLNSTAAVEDEALAKVQADWLKQVLSNNPNRWTIAIYHHPMFSVSLGRDNPRLRQYWQPLFDQYKVDLVLQGHDHVYGRYQPENKGPLYMVSVAGPKMYLVSKEARAKMAQVGEDTQLFQQLDISENQLKVKAMTVTGRLYDSFTLKRQSDGSNLLQQQFKAKVASCSAKTINDNKCWQGTEFSAAESAPEKKMKYSLITTLVSAAMLMACQAQSQNSTAINSSAAVYAELRTTVGQFQSSATALVWQDGKGTVIQQWPGVFRRLKALPQADGSVLLAAIETESNQLHWWQLQGKTVQRSGKQLVSQLVVDDLCWYQSAQNKQLSLFLIGDRGLGEQWLLAQDSSFLAAPLSIRNLNLPTDATACAVDQQKGTLYLAEGAKALWSYNAEVEADEGRSLIDVQAPLGKLTGEVKALEFTAGNTLVALQEEPALLQSYQTQGDSLVWQQSKAITALESAEQLGLSAGILSVVSEEGQHTQLKDKAYQAQAAVLPERSTLPMQQLSPTLETVAVSYRGDAIDDPAVWQDAKNPDNSRILATDKRAGVAVYNMKGEQLQFLNVGRVNNIDLRYGLEYQGKKQDIAAATLRADNSVQLFAIDAQGQVKTALKFATPFTDIYGLCLYQSKRSGQTYVFANDKDGTVLQYQISSIGQNWSAKEVRRLKVPSQPEGCVADDQNDLLFLGEEDVGVWRFAADAKADTKGELVIKADGDVLVADVEGLALLSIGEPGKAGKPTYLLASSQGNDSYVLFQTTAPYKAVARFRVRLNAELGIDGSSETDGLELTTLSLGQGFEQGAVIVQDGRNRMPEQGQNLKLVPLQQVLELLPAH